MKKYSTTPALLGLCAAVMIGSGPAVAMAGEPEFEAAASAPAFINQTDRLIVKYKDSEPSAKGAAKVASLDRLRMAIIARAGQQFGLQMRLMHATATGAHVMKLDKMMSVDEVEMLAKELAERDPNVEYAEPDRMMQKMFTPNDPRYNEQWHYYETAGGLRANTAWDKATGSGVNVAVIDTGYRPHADLAGKFVQGYDFISNATTANDGGGRDSDAQDPGDGLVAGECGNGQPAQDQRSSWHGTHVAGTIAAATNNGVGVAGVAYNARIVPVRVLGKCGGYTSDIADAIIWASGGTVSGAPANANKARVINMSLGGGGACSTTTQNAINSARSRGTVVIVAAGNSNTNASGANPANCAGVVTVAATNRSGGRAYYSNYGTVVDVAAPGGDTRVAGGGVLSTLNTGAKGPVADSYAFYQGTSMATPHVAGVAALMLSKNINLTPDEIESKLKSSARAFPAACSGCGTGIVNASAAVDAAAGVSPTPTPGATLNESEANNTTGTANPVTTSGTTVLGNMGSTTDSDYFVVQLPGGKTLTSTLTMGAATADYDLYVYNSAGTLIAKSENPAGSGDAVSVTNAGTSTYARYVRVKYYSGGTGATSGKYTLKLSW
jgi:serine protease